ncbi:MAG TPA: hypothetical protein VKV26_04730 [Dehalococcoidia bacterium]|nr:hypothetical protein [Dehalococcoidia bacterium]
MNETRPNRRDQPRRPAAARPLSRRRPQAAAALADACGAAAFVWLPWASGHEALAGRRFDGPQLARLVHNAGVLLGSAGALAGALSLALWAVPAAALIAAVFALGARLTDRPSAVLRWAIAFSLVAPIVAIVVALLLVAGPEAGRFLTRQPGPGLLLCAAAGGVAAIAAYSAIE